MSNAADPARLRRAAALGLLAAGVALIVAAGAVETLAVPATRWRLDRQFSLGLGGLLLALGAVGPWLPARLGVALAAGAWAAVAALGLGYRAPKAGDTAVSAREMWQAVAGGARGPKGQKTYESKDEWLDAFTMEDDRFGLIGQPGAKARHVKHAFDVTYSLDEDGFRVMPVPERADYQLAFLGCSYAFGHGVEDGQPFPAVLAAQAWKQCRVRNYSIPGWGTAQACLMLEDLLSSSDPPQCVLYCWITHHLRRNYLSESWHGRINRVFPLFDVVDGDAVFLGPRTHEDANWPDGEKLDAAELDVTLHLIESMQRLCDMTGTTFGVLLLQRVLDDPVAQALEADGRIHVWDLSKVSNEFLPEDRHPTWRWHQALAHALAADPRLAEWTGRSDLHQPSAVPPPPPSWQLSINYTSGASANLYDRSVVRTPEDVALRVDDITTSQPVNPWAVQLNRDGLAVTAEKEYRVRFRARADKLRPLRFAMIQAHAPWDALGPWQNVSLGRRWQQYEMTFTAQLDEQQARLSLVLGDDAAAIEIDDIVMECDGANLLAPAPQSDVSPQSDSSPPP